MEPTKVPRARGESRLSLLQGLGILIVVGIAAKLLLEYFAK